MPKQAEESQLTKPAQSLPAGDDSVADSSDLGRLITAMWSHRLPLLVAAIVCGVSGGTAATLRPHHWVGTVHLAIGHILPVDQLQDPGELAQRLKSSRQVLKMAGMAHCWRKPVDQANIEGCPTLLILESNAIEDTSLVSFTVETNGAEISQRIVTEVTNEILGEHMALFDEIQEANQRNITEFEELLKRLEKDLAREQKAVPKRTVTGEPAPWSVWPEVVAVRQHIEKLRGFHLSARARPTRAVSGPDVDQKDRKPDPAVAALLGAFAGFAFAGLAIAARQAVAQRS
ncbi:MAG: hypothetical protein V3T05_02065 [Myxococcota bacterium]